MYHRKNGVTTCIVRIYLLGYASKCILRIFCRSAYLRARYYAPGYGRFTQIDPIRDGTKWYAYCDNDPVNKIDPSGMAPYEKFRTIEEALLDFAWNNFGKSNYVLVVRTSQFINGGFITKERKTNSGRRKLTLSMAWKEEQKQIIGDHWIEND